MTLVQTVYSQINKYTIGRACACFSFRACTLSGPSLQGGLERSRRGPAPTLEMPMLVSLVPLPGTTPSEGAKTKGKVSVLRQGASHPLHCPCGHSCGVQVSSRASMSLLKSCRKSEQHHNQHLPQCQVRAKGARNLERASKASLIPACSPPAPFEHPGHPGMFAKEIQHAAEALVRDVELFVAHQQ